MNNLLTKATVLVIAILGFFFALSQYSSDRIHISIEHKGDHEHESGVNGVHHHTGEHDNTKDARPSHEGTGSWHTHCSPFSDLAFPSVKSELVAGMTVLLEVANFQLKVPPMRLVFSSQFRPPIF